MSAPLRPAPRPPGKSSLWLIGASALATIATGILIFVTLVALVLEVSPGLGGGGKGSLLGPLPMSAVGARPPFGATDPEGTAFDSSQAVAAPAMRSPATRLTVGAPLVWLSLAAGSGAVAWALHRRLLSGHRALRRPR
jgi:hypothetical protein